MEALQPSQKHVKYNTWNVDSMPLPTISRQRHTQSLKQILSHV